MASPFDSILGKIANTLHDTFGIGGDQPKANAKPTKDDTKNEYVDNLKVIEKTAQTFLTSGLMSKGLTVESFVKAKPGSHWQKRFPYKLTVARVSPNGLYKTIASFRLPINPQDMTTKTPFAIKTSVTSRGILEEHNGIPLKQISIKGTTGVRIDKGVTDYKAKTQDTLAGGIFAGTANAIGAFQSSITTAKQIINNDNTQVLGNNDSDVTTTGYYQYHMLRMFLETYAEAKKQGNNRDLRLLFINSKDVLTYIVTPQDFTTQRSVSSPQEYIYSLQLLAWGSISGTGSGNFDSGPAKTQNTNPLSGNNISSLFDKLSALRTSVQAFRNIISSVKSDIESNIFGPINQTILLAKDILGIPLAVADFPKSLRDSFMSTVGASLTALSATNEELKSAIADAGLSSSFETINQESNPNQAIQGNSANKTQATGQSSPVKSDTTDDLKVTEKLNLSSIQQTDAQKDAVAAAVYDAKNQTSNDIKSFLKTLEDLSTALEPLISIKGPLEEEWELLYTINDAVSGLYTMLSDDSFHTSANDEEDASGNAFLSTNAITFWEQSTSNYGITYTKPTSKFAVPFPFKFTLEQISAIYLGDASRWMEIASLNGLQAPYVDEDGFIYKFIANGDGNQFNISSGTNLYVDQTIYINSNSSLVKKYTIKAINEITTTNWLITVDGDVDLSVFQVSDGAQMKAYLPYTINSLKKIYIPLEDGVDPTEPETKPITFLKEDIEWIKFSKIDWLLDSNNDLAVASDGFINLAYGTTNLIQAAKKKLMTPKGGLMLYPEYGGGAEVGDNFADINLGAQAKAIAESFESDSRFNSPSSINISASPGVLNIEVIASVAKDDGVLPISLPISRG